MVLDTLLVMRYRLLRNLLVISVLDENAATHKCNLHVQYFQRYYSACLIESLH